MRPSALDPTALRGAVTVPPSTRRRDRLTLATAILSVLGIAVAGYLTLVHYRQNLLVCGVTNGCHTVQSSSYAVVAGIPIAVLGVGMYVALLGAALLRLARPAGPGRERLTMAAFTVALGGVAYALYLTYVELFVIDAICQWCVASALITLAIGAVEGVAVWRALDPDPAEVD